MQSAGRYILHSRTIKNVYRGGKHDHLPSSLHIVKRLDHDAIFAIFRISASSPNNWPFPRAPAKSATSAPGWDLVIIIPIHIQSSPSSLKVTPTVSCTDSVIFDSCTVRTVLGSSDPIFLIPSSITLATIYSSGLRKHLRNHRKIIKCSKYIHNSIHFNFTIHKYNLVHICIDTHVASSFDPPIPPLQVSRMWAVRLSLPSHWPRIGTQTSVKNTISNIRQMDGEVLCLYHHVYKYVWI